MGKSPYINAIITIVIIVAIVVFVDLYIHQGTPAVKIFENAVQENSITGDVIATSYGLEYCSSCACIQKQPYTNGPLSFSMNLPSSSCTVTTCQKEGESRFGHPYWIARVREGVTSCAR